MDRKQEKTPLKIISLLCFKDFIRIYQDQHGKLVLVVHLTHNFLKSLQFFCRSTIIRDRCFVCLAFSEKFQ